MASQNKDNLSYILIIKHLQLHDCTSAGFTSGIFKHATQDSLFSLVFDDFGLKYTSKKYALNLIDTLKKKYPVITIYCSGRIFLSIHLDWDYTKLTVPISMPNYVNKSLSIFQHKKPKHDQHSPHPHATSNYGAKIQYETPSTTSNLT